MTRFLKGVFELRPALPRYKEIWDVSLVLNMLESWKLGSTLTLKDLTLKVTMLLALLSGQRLQTLKAFSVKSMTLTDTKCVFQINVPLKTTRPGRHMSALEFCEYTPSDDLCIVKHLKFYLNLTSTLRRDCDQLLITYNKPHRAASSATIGRWLKTVMTKSGIDTQQFGAHSTRVAAASAAFSKKVSVDTILSAAGWSNVQTFARYYNKPLLPQERNFGDELLIATHHVHSTV